MVALVFRLYQPVQVEPRFGTYPLETEASIIAIKNNQRGSMLEAFYPILFSLSQITTFPTYVTV